MTAPDAPRTPAERAALDRVAAMLEWDGTPRIALEIVLEMARRVGAAATPVDWDAIEAAMYLPVRTVKEEFLPACYGCAVWKSDRHASQCPYLPILALRAAATPREGGADATYERAAGRAWKETLDTIRATSSDEEG